MTLVPGKMIYNFKKAVKNLTPDSMLPLLRKTLRRLTAGQRDKKRRTGRPIAQDHLTRDLQAAGFAPGDLVMIHASLSAIGNVVGGADAVVQSWLDVITPSGTIIMPCFNSASEMEKDLERGKLIDLRTSPSATGKISETFRVRHDVVRSSHPFSSACAWGKRAMEVTSAHALSPFVCHESSPVARLIDFDGVVVGIGIPIAQGLGVAHYLEDTWDGFPFEVHSDPRKVSYIDSEGKTISRMIGRYDPKVSRTRIDHPEGRWICEQLTGHLIKAGILKMFAFGEADAWQMKASILRDELKRLAQKGVTMYLTKDQLTPRNQNPEDW